MVHYMCITELKARELHTLNIINIKYYLRYHTLPHCPPTDYNYCNQYKHTQPFTVNFVNTIIQHEHKARRGKGLLR